MFFFTYYTNYWVKLKSLSRFWMHLYFRFSPVCLTAAQVLPRSLGSNIITNSSSSNNSSHLSQIQPLTQSPVLLKNRVLSPRQQHRRRSGRSRRTIPTRTGVLFVRTEESCSVVTSVPKFFISPVTSPPSTSLPGEMDCGPVFIGTVKIRSSEWMFFLLSFFLCFFFFSHSFPSVPLISSLSLFPPCLYLSFSICYLYVSLCCSM